MGVKKGPRARAAERTARGGTLRAAPSGDARGGRRDGGEVRDVWLAGRRSRRARPPRAPRAARGKGRQSARDGTRTGGSLMSRRVPSPFETRASGRRARSLLRSRKRALALLVGSSRVCSRARCVAHARATALVFPLPRQKAPRICAVPLSEISPPTGVSRSRSTRRLIGEARPRRFEVWSFQVSNARSFF